VSDPAAFEPIERLICIECGASTASPARGWKAYFARDPTEDDELELTVYCPACAEREFGEDEA
jgi:hypothetical protein